MTHSERKPRRRLSMISVASVASLGILSACSGNSIKSFDPKLETVKTSESLQFQNINPMIQMAAAYGDKGAGGHGTFGKFPGNFKTPEHTHTGAYHGVVIKGALTNPFNGDQNPPKMTAGSYWYVPAGIKHATACVSSTPCEFYFHADSAFDFHPLK